MKNTKKGRMAASILSALLCAGLALFSAGCGSDSDSSESGSGVNEVEQDSSKGITSVALDRATLSLLTGTTAELTATVETTSGDIAKTVTWTSSDESVATVSDGTVTAVAAGSATITAASTVDTTKKATCSVTVESANSSEVLWRADEYEAQTCTDDQTLGIMTVIVGGGSVLVDANSKSIDGYSFAKRLKFGGSGSTSKNSIKFTTTDSATITVYFISGSSGNSRTLNLSDGTDVVASGTNDGTAIASFSTTSAVAAGTYYIYSAGSGINVYAVKIAYESAQNIVYPSAVSLSASTLSLDVSDDSTTKTATLTATIANASEVTSGKDTIEWTSSNTSVATVSNGVVTAKKAGTATITAAAKYGSAKATCEVTVTGTASGKTISLTDKPVGYASLGTNYVTSGTQTIVTTRSELVDALKNGGVIVIDGMIDMSEGKLWTSGNTSLSTATTALDSFVTSTVSSYSSYADWVDKYTAACSATTEDGDSESTTKSSLYDNLWKLNNAYGNLIQVTISNDGTTLIGKDENCGIRGGSIQINGKKNIIIRNLTIQDPCDPFPHHEVKSDGSTSDGYNAQWDGICIQGSSSYIWVDHCTFEDTLTLAYTTNSTKEKWQIFDGLCDMKGDSTNITVSNCHFKNHDKTMLIGSSDSDGNNSKRFVSLIGNYFENCGQRLPMVRNSTIHVLNNYYTTSGSPYSSQSCVNARKNAIVYAENNYFGSGCKYSFNAADGDSTPVLHSSGNSGEKVSSTSNISATDSTLFSSLNVYTYTAVTADEAKTNAEENAGAGYLLN